MKTVFQLSFPQGVSTLILVNWVGVCGLLVAIVFSLLDPSSYMLSPAILSVSSADWLTLIGLAVCGLSAFSLQIKALHLIAPSLVASLRATELVVAFVVQTILTGQAPNMWDCLGGSLVMTGVLLLSMQKKIDNFVRSRINNPYDKL